MAFPRPDAASKAFFDELVAGDRRASVRPMFGNFAGFANGQMFIGVFGAQVFLRLPEKDRATIIACGGAPFEPMKGRPMKEYVVLPVAWRDDIDEARAWVGKSVAFVGAMPAKAGAKRPAKKSPRR